MGSLTIRALRKLVRFACPSIGLFVWLVPVVLEDHKARAQTVVISTDQTTTQNLDTLAGGDPGTSAIVNPGVTVDTSNPPGSGGNAIVGGSRPWELTNGGFITGQNRGVDLSAGGSVTNSAGSSVTAVSLQAIRIRNAPGTVINAGTVLARRESVLLTGGGSVTNETGASITSTTREAIQIQGGSGTVVNAGTLLGQRETILLLGGGSVTNDAGASITSTAREAIQIQGGAGTVNNAGTIDSRLEGVLLNSGGTVTNALSGLIQSAIREGIQISGSAGTVDNLGTVDAGTIGVFLDRGGSLTNHEGATITGGTIGARVDNGGTLDNLAGATITGNNGSGVEMRGGGTVVNGAGSTISGTTRGVFITGGGGSGQLTNEGTITGNQFGVFLNNGGTVTNLAGATISGNTEGLRVNNGVTNITNAGTISGAGTAIRFGNAGDTLTLQTGSVLNGNVNGRGGNDQLFLEGTGTEDSNFQNFEGLTMQGTDWTLSGTSGFNNATITSGTLRITGTLNSPTTIGPAGILGGNGTIGGSVTNNGQISPGAGPATLTITNNYTHAAGAVYNVDIEPAGTSDQLSVGGTATLNGGTVVVTAAPGTYAPGTVYTIVDAATVAGTFDGVVSNSAFVTPSLVHNASTVQLAIAVAPFTTFAATPNQLAIANYVDLTAPSATGDYATVVGSLFSLEPDAYRNALDAVSGDVYPSTTELAIQTHDQFNTTIGTRINNYWVTQRGLLDGVGLAAQDNGLAIDFASGASQIADGGGLWFQGYYVTGDLDGDGNAAGTDFDIQGIAGGIDAQVSDTLLLGVAAGTSWTTGDFSSRNNARVDIDSYEVGAYGSYFDGFVGLDGIVSLGVQDADSERPIAFGAIQRTATASYDSHVIAAYGEASVLYDIADDTQIQPLVGLRYSDFESDGFQETGAGSLNITTNGFSRESLRSSLGLRLTHQDMLNDGTELVPWAYALWSHEFLDRSVSFNGSLAGAIAGPTFSVAGVESSRDSLDLGGGLSIATTENLSVFAGYGTSLSTDGVSHTFQGGLRFHW
ncbi:MAG: autotransporter domain-containing protein [Pseudomonadota bacterium]